jgi:hypothetical protein
MRKRNDSTKNPEESTEEKKTQLRHKKVRKIRQNPEALSDLPIELFLRIVGLFYTIPIEIRNSPQYLSTSNKFEDLRLFIDSQLANDNGEDFAKYEMADYVHNLHLILVGVMPMDFLESHIHHLREEYRGHVNEQVYKVYLTSKTHQFIDKYCCYTPVDPEFIKIKKVYESKMRHEYRNLVNEIRKARLFEIHIEDTREFLMKSVMITYLKLIALPVIVISIYCFFIWHVDSAIKNKLPTAYQDIYNYYLTAVNSAAINHSVAWFNGLIGIILICLSGIFGASGSLISALLRIQGVRDNSQLAQNIVAFKYSVNALKIAPLTGFIFAIVLSLIFSAGLMGGRLFPEVRNSWTNILFENDQLAKWLVWCFIAGFSERLVPDMVDRLSAKAKKAEESR